MSILGPFNEDGPQPKRRKVSNDTHIDPRFYKSSSSASKPETSDSDELPETVEQSRNGHLPRPQRQKPSTSLPTGGLNKSSILTIQLNELLATSTPKYDSQISKIDASIQRIKQLIRDVPRTGTLSLKEGESLIAKSGVTIPFPSPRPGKETNLKFEYDQPSSIEVQSGLHLRLGIKGQQLIKIVVIMPQRLLQEKDYLNHRAFHKRAFYLAPIAAYLKKEAPDEFELQYDHEDDVVLTPGITLIRKRKSAAKANKTPNHIFFITVNFPDGAFAIEKTMPTKNCVRPESRSESSELEPTPSYNSILNSQQTYRHNQDILSKTIEKCPSFADACRAGQIWLRERGFDSSVSSGGFGMWEWAILSAILLVTGGHKGHSLFSEKYSSLQLFKAMLQVLSGRDMTDPWVLHADDLALPKSDSPTLYDGQTGVNILHKMMPWSYQILHHHAQVSLASVNSKRDNSFEVTFDMRIAQPQFQYDEIYSINLSDHNDVTAEHQRDMLHNLYLVMKRGLGDRVTLLDLKCPFPQPSSISKTLNTSAELQSLELRLVLDMNATSRLIEHGPSADEQEAAIEFRKFWGAKSELRRFKDGSISESLVWSASRPVTEQIIEHLVERHFKAKSTALTSLVPDLEGNFLDSGSPVTAIEAFKLINNQFQTLSSSLHQLEGLPLPIRSISPANHALRSSAMQHPLLSSTSSPISIVIQFDSSTRWPDSLPAIQHTKIAFLIKLAELLSANSTLTTRVGLENTLSQHSGYLNTSYLDVTYPAPHPYLSPITFRIRIHHDRELSLLQSQLSKSLPPPERTQLQSALTAHKRLLASPLHTTIIRTLITRFPPLSPTIRLLKSFFASHHLSNLLPPELLETIAAHIFLSPSPFSVPGSATTAFFRILHLLSRWDWSITPLIIDLGVTQQMSENMREELKSRFQAWRKLDPKMNSVSWFIGTSLDSSGVVWAEGGKVEKVVAGRVRALAQGVMDVLHQHEESAAKVEEKVWQEIFTGDTSAFDFLLHLNPALVKGAATISASRLHSNTTTTNKKSKAHPDTRFKNLQLPHQTPQLSGEEIGFDPIALYLTDLHHSFGHVALFFYGEGQDVICGLWRPGVMGDGREWRVRLGWSSTPLGNGTGTGNGDGDGDEKVREEGAEEKHNVLCEFNKSAVLVEIGMLGEGIVREIKVKEE